MPRTDERFYQSVSFWGDIGIGKAGGLGLLLGDAAEQAEPEQAELIRFANVGLGVVGQTLRQAGARAGEARREPAGPGRRVQCFIFHTQSGILPRFGKKARFSETGNAKRRFLGRFGGIDIADMFVEQLVAS